MEKAFLGETSKLGFGAMRLPKIEDDTINQNLVNEMVSYAIENGVNYFDTSFVYHGGRSEIALGIALEPYKRDTYYLADKMTFSKVDSRNDMDDAFKLQCEKLKTDYIDFYLLHALDQKSFDKVLSIDGIAWAMEKKAQGKIKYLGFSIHDDIECLKRILDSHDFDFAQIQYNYMDLEDNPGQAGYNELVKRNIPIVIMEPLKGGALANIPSHIAGPFERLNKSCASFSFRWLAEQKGIMTILSGMSALEHVKSNVEIFRDIKPLSDEEHEAIKQVKANLESLQKVKCTACGYCMPCPVEIDIPGSFRAWNTRAMLSSKENWFSGTSVDKDAVSGCAECGKCRDACPQKIDVPHELKRMLSEI